jgi:class 3 adenylate cyclase
VVTVLFCDLVGFTASSDQADPEDVRARIRPYHARLRTEVERFGGTVEKFIGDAVMAVFGAPVAHEDDPERAVRAALKILEAMSELDQADPGLGLRVRIGITTGEAVVALGARLEHGEGIVTGDVVNTASRLQGWPRPEGSSSLSRPTGPPLRSSTTSP